MKTKFNKTGKKRKYQKPSGTKISDNTKITPEGCLRRGCSSGSSSTG